VFATHCSLLSGSGGHFTEIHVELSAIEIQQQSNENSQRLSMPKPLVDFFHIKRAEKT
jgi:hypothetical protein